MEFGFNFFAGDELRRQLPKRERRCPGDEFATMQSSVGAA